MPNYILQLQIIHIEEVELVALVEAEVIAEEAAPVEETIYIYCNYY